MDKRLYVLEDIDCGGLGDVMKKRKPDVVFNEAEDYEEIDSTNSSFEEAVSERDEHKPKKHSKDDFKKELTLSDLLEVFDGVLESKVSEGHD